MLKVQELREIIRLIDQSSISEFVYENDGSTITIKKPTVREQVNVVEEVIQTPPVVQAPAVEKKEEVVKEVPKQETDTEVAEVDDENVVEIVSPMVGTFYRKP